MLRTASPLSRLLLVSCAAIFLLASATSADARTRRFCSYEHWSGYEYRGYPIDCGGHLEPACTGWLVQAGYSQRCDAGLNEYSGDPFPLEIECPVIDLGVFGEIDVPDDTVSVGCYDEVPSCDDCGGEGQVGCPEAAASFCDVGCEPGLEPNPNTTLCEEPGTPGGPCGPGIPCGDGLTCNLPTLTCIAHAGAGSSCLNPWVDCAEGLYCRGDFTCQPYRKPGEGCSIANPCIEGATCEACLAGSCNAPLQCFPDRNQGILTEHQCLAMYSPGDSDLAQDVGATLTYAAGDGAAAGVAEAQSLGVAYGDDGSYGCFTTLCAGVNIDVAIGAFISVGFYDEYEAVGGPSWASFEAVSAPGDLVSFTTSQVFERDSLVDLTPGRFIGTEDAFGLGAGPNPFPLSGGVFLCETVLDTVIDGSGGIRIEPPPPPPVTDRSFVNANFDADLTGWRCGNAGFCSWIPEDPFASSISGAGRVSSPTNLNANPGRLNSGCRDVDAGMPLVVGAWLRASGSEHGVLRARWYASDDCTTGFIESDLVAHAAPDGSWQEWRTELIAPQSARTISLNAEAYRNRGTQAASTLEIDAVSFSDPPLPPPLTIATLRTRVQELEETGSFSSREASKLDRKLAKLESRWDSDRPVARKLRSIARRLQKRIDRGKLGVEVGDLVNLATAVADELR